MTAPMPWPRKAAKARKNAVSAAMECIYTLEPLIRRPDQVNRQEQAEIIALVIYNQHYIIDQLTSIPAHDER